MQTIFFVSHTHWDREWYAPFQVFRLRLVECIDQLLDIFATQTDYRYFLLDGQTIVLEDYLEVRPDREQTLRKLVRTGRVQIGPWYVLPDEFLVSGEAIVRNLQRGIRIANDSGRLPSPFNENDADSADEKDTAPMHGAMQIGYLPDPFGHISQMPQILRGFGIGTAAFRRGLADEPTELWWQSPDGTRVLACYLRDGYDNAAWMRRDEVGFVDDLTKLRDSLAPHTATGKILLLNGTDHMEPWADLPRLLDAARARDAATAIVHASLPMYVAAVQDEMAQRNLNLEIVHGELRNPKRHHLLPGVASTRTWIKQRNAHAQMLLEKWAEPFAAYAALGDGGWNSEVGKPRFHFPTSSLQPLATAWKYLLQNQPHDSICGCGIDQVHAEMATRFDWVEQIAGQIVEPSLATIARSVDARAFPDRLPIVVFNPGTGPRNDVVIARIETTGNKEISALSDEAGNEIPYQIQSRPDHPSELEIEFVARDVPACGYRTFFAVSSVSHTPSPTSPITHHSSLVLENEYYRVEPNHDDGTLDIVDKTNGAVYRGVNRFVDGGDRGDLYNYCPPENDTQVATPSAPPQIQVERGAVRQSLRIAMNYRLPARLGDYRSTRAPETIDQHIVTVVSIYPGVQRIDFRTQVDNRACDHRLRLEFPTPIVTAYANAEQAFDVVQRTLDLPTDTGDWIEQPRPEAPMQGFVSIDNGSIGMTLATRGLPEYQARRDAEGTTLALTLLRCTGWLSRDDLSTRTGHAGPALETPGAQEIGTHVFEYALIPHAGDWRNALADAQAFTAPLRAVTSPLPPLLQGEGRRATPNRALPPTASFVGASPREFVISAIKQAEDGSGLVVRGYNVREKTIDTRIVTWRDFARAARMNLNEEEIAPMELLSGREVTLQVRAKEIVTVKFVE